MVIKMEVDKVFAGIGEELNYTLTMYNTRGTPIHDVCLIDNLPKEILRIQESIQLDKQPIRGISDQGILIGTIVENETKTLKFKGIIKELPPINPIVHIADVSFRMQIGGEKQLASSNTSITVVNDPNISTKNGFTLVVDKEMVQQDGEITYTIELVNQGNTPAEALKFMNLVPKGASLLIESLQGASVERLSEGIWHIGDLNVGERKVFSYKMKVKQDLEQYELVHEVELDYSFLLPDRSRVSRRCSSQKAYTKICLASFNKALGGFTKSVSQTECTLGEHLTYTLQLINQGNTTATLIHLQDEIPEGVTFVPDSLKINNQYYQASEWPKEGMTLQDIHGQESLEVTYEVEVGDKLLADNILGSLAKVSYAYVVEEEFFENQETSTEAITLLGAAIVDEESLQFISREEEVTLGDTIHYQIRLKNIGNLIASGVKLDIEIPDGLQVMSSEWVQQDNQAYLKYKADLLPQQFYEIDLEIKLDTLFTGGVIHIPCKLTYGYHLGLKHNQQVIQIEEAITKVKIAAIQKEQEGFIKRVDKSHVQVGDRLNYSIVLQNKGNTQAQKLSLKETLPPELQFVEGSLRIDNKTIEEGLDSPIHLGELDVETIKIITYSAEVLELPPSETVCPTSLLTYTYEVGYERIVECYHEGIMTQIYEVSLDYQAGSVAKEVDKTYATVGEHINYTVILTNTGNLTVKQVQIKPITNDALINDKIEHAIEMGDIPPKESRIITYDIPIEQVPEDGKIISRDEIKYRFDIGQITLEGKGQSPELTTLIEEAKLVTEGTRLQQVVSETIAQVGEVLTYRLPITNRGNTTARHIKLTLPEVEGGEWLNEQMMVIEKLEPGGKHEYSYQLAIQELPHSEIVSCEPLLTYTYRLGDHTHYERQETIPAQVTAIQHASLEGPEGEIVGRVSSQYATIGEALTYELELINTGNIKLYNIYLEPLLPDNIRMIPHSFKLNEQAIELQSHDTISLDQLVPQETMHISYQLKIEDLPEEVPLTLPALLTYAYEIEKEPIPQKVRQEISSQKIIINLAAICVEKGLDKIEVTPGERIDYQIICRNEGNTEAEEVRVHQKLPKGMRIAKEDSYLKEEINLGSIRPGEEKQIKFQVEVENYVQEEQCIDTTQVAYKMKVDPTKDKRPMEVQPIHTTFEVKHPKIVANITSEIHTGIIGEVIPYRFELCNQGNVDVTYIRINQPLPHILTKLPGSTRINGIPYEEEESNSIILSQLLKEEKVEITFDMQILQKGENNPLLLNPEITYQFNIREEAQEKQVKAPSLALTIEEIKLEIEKRSDKEGAKINIGDEINYRIRITNVGTMPIEQTLLYDKLPSGTVLMGESIKVGDQLITGYPLGEGINLGPIKFHESKYVTYKIKVQEYYEKRIKNEAYVEYMVRREPNLPLIRRQTPIEVHELKVASLEKVALPYKNVLTLPYQYPDIYEILELEVKSMIIHTSLSPESKQVAQIRGQIQYTLIYRGTDKQMHTMTWMKLFVKKIQLMMAVEDGELAIQTKVDKQYVETINGREVDTRVLVELNET